MQFVYYILKKSIHHIYRQAIAWTKTDSVFIGILRTNFGEFRIKIYSKMVAMFLWLKALR